MNNNDMPTSTYCPSPKPRTDRCLYLLGLLFLALIEACSPLISTFDQYAYTQTTSLKVDALNLMDKATDKYDNHINEIENIRTNFQKIYEYEKNRPNNEITTKMWYKLMSTDTTNHLFTGFINFWKVHSTVSQIYLDSKKDEISQAFDQIAQLESAKIKPSEIKP